MPRTTLVRDVMTNPVLTLHPDEKVEHAADVLAERNVGALPVVDVDGKLVGILRDDDLIASEARVHVPTFINFLGLGMAFPGEMKHLEKELKKIAGATVGDIMQTDPPTVTSDATLEDVASILHERGVNSIPVVDEAGKVVGIVARADIVRFIARTT
ncbi:MAG TPA: CBS domain-containing protein [Acidimicrobiia bacterium]|jgi:CBS domain-containing protein|nr:CBS domain-containing protein [Acidimicrobiia bacterium]